MSAFTQSHVHIYTFGIWEKLREGGGGVGGGEVSIKISIKQQNKALVPWSFDKSQRFPNVSHLLPYCLCDLSKDVRTSLTTERLSGLALINVHHINNSIGMICVFVFFCCCFFT